MPSKLFQEKTQREHSARWVFYYPEFPKFPIPQIGRTRPGRQIALDSGLAILYGPRVRRPLPTQPDPKHLRRWPARTMLASQNPKTPKGANLKMTQQKPPKFACNICKQSYPDQQSLLKHFSAHHATKKCKICHHEAAKNGDFCFTCRNAFACEIENLQELTNKIEKLSFSLKSAQASKIQQEHLLREAFLKKRSELFCSHDLPRDVECKKCEVKPSTKPVLRVSLEDFPAGTLKRIKKPILRLSL